MQEPDPEVAINVHTVGEPDVGVAVKVTVAPTANPLTSIVGVSSAVFLSLLKDPKSDEEFRVTPVGASIETVMLLADTGERFPAASAM